MDQCCRVKRRATLSWLTLKPCFCKSCCIAAEFETEAPSSCQTSFAFQALVDKLVTSKLVTIRLAEGSEDEQFKTEQNFKLTYENSSTLFGGRGHGCGCGGADGAWGDSFLAG